MLNMKGLSWAAISYMFIVPFLGLIHISMLLRKSMAEGLHMGQLLQRCCCCRAVLLGWKEKQTYRNKQKKQILYKQIIRNHTLLTQMMRLRRLRQLCQVESSSKQLSSHRSVRQLRKSRQELYQALQVLEIQLQLLQLLVTFFSSNSPHEFGKDL